MFFKRPRSQVVRRRSAKPLFGSSILPVASQRSYDLLFKAGVMEQVDIGGLKLPARKGVWVRVPPPAHIILLTSEVNSQFCADWYE